MKTFDTIDEATAEAQRYLEWWHEERREVETLKAKIEKLKTSFKNYINADI